MNAAANTNPSQPQIPKKSLGPVAVIVLAILVIALMIWMLGIAFVNPGQNFGELLQNLTG
jgi:hypothetical protein